MYCCCCYRSSSPLAPRVSPGRGGSGPRGGEGSRRTRRSWWRLWCRCWSDGEGDGKEGEEEEPAEKSPKTLASLFQVVLHSWGHENIVFSTLAERRKRKKFSPPAKTTVKHVLGHPPTDALRNGAVDNLHTL